jgi:hypothetical protein
MPILHPPTDWATTPAYSQFLELWHGCLKSDLKSIRKGIDPTVCDPSTDFGRGFYTTTVKRQARSWAWKRYLDLSPRKRKRDVPVVLRFRIRLERLARLESLFFVLGDYDQDRFWSLVHHCRQSTLSSVNTHCHPGRKRPDDWYDVVSGPIAAFWPQRVAMVGSDQMSFHTVAGAQMLSDLIHSGNKDDFRAFRVRPQRKRRMP